MQLFLRKKQDYLLTYSEKKKINHDNSVCLCRKQNNKSFYVLTFNPVLRSLEATIFKFLNTYIQGKKFSLIQIKVRIFKSVKGQDSCHFVSCAKSQACSLSKSSALACSHSYPPGNDSSHPSRVLSFFFYRGSLDS